MADPLTDPSLVPPVAASDPPADPPAPSEAELLRQQNERLQQMLEQQGAALNDVRAQLATSAAPVQTMNDDPNAAFWTDPSAHAARIAEEKIQSTIAPQAAAINEKLGRIAVNNFLASKSASPYYAACVETFKKEIANIPLAMLGAASDDQIQRTLDVAWDAAVGKYAQEYRAKNPPPPPNLGGGSGAGGTGPGGKKTLLELDPNAYNWAMRNGLSAEQMQQIADEIQEENS